MLRRHQRKSPNPLANLHTALKAADSRIHALNSDTLARQIQLAAIPAPTGSETQRGLAVANMLHSLTSNKPRVDEAGNVVARFSHAATDHSSAPIVCLAHLDTVFGSDVALLARREGERLYCPGIGDNSRGLTAMLTLVRLLHDDSQLASTLRRPVEFVATVGEEGLGNLRGARAYFAACTESNKPAPHAVLVLDGPGDANIVHHALGSRRYRIWFRGAGGHSWVDFGAPNAVHSAARAAAWLSEVPRSMHARVALTVSGIGGGESMNAIPASAWIDVDVRTTETHSLTRVDAELRKIVAAAAKAERGDTAPAFTFGRRDTRNSHPIQTEITVIGERPCGSLPAEHSLVQIAQAASLHYGIEPVSAVASTDANVPLSLGIPAITIGAGGTGGGAHTVHEWYDNTHGARGVARAFAILAAVAA